MVYYIAVVGLTMPHGGVMTEKLVRGVSAAVLTPRLPDGSVDAPSLRKLLEFLLERGISSFALNGATGEFCITTPTQLRALLSAAKEVAGDAAEFLCGVGAPDTAGSIIFARIAQDAGVKGLLLPMPYFFPYQQGDLEEFSRSVAAAVSLPVLLYNLPQFTSGLQKETVHTLITEVPNIIGIKDSGGSLDILRHLSEQRVDACRIVGDDSVLSAALRANVCDGVISGVACAVPELILALYGRGQQDGSVEFAQATQALDELIAQLSVFPTPWGLKWIAQARGVLQAAFPLPNSPTRTAQGRQLELWFKEWFHFRFKSWFQS
jgi:4-hydroxy-tetrahydrodipicolinate synthase